MSSLIVLADTLARAINRITHFRPFQISFGNQVFIAVTWGGLSLPYPSLYPKLTARMKIKDWVLIFFILIKFLLQYILINPVYELHRDEYLYLDQAHHLAWGYLSVPPVFSWISTLIHFLGNSVFLVKFFPALFGALTLIIV